MNAAIAKAAVKAAAEGQFVTLAIDREVFAVPVESVLEILDMRQASRIPESPPYMLGLIDLRGRSIPVLDLRLKLGLPAVPPTETTRILVLEVTISRPPACAGPGSGPRHRSHGAERGRDRACAGHRCALALRIHPRRRSS